MVRSGAGMGRTEEWALASTWFENFYPGIDLNICGLGLDMGQDQLHGLGPDMGQFEGPIWIGLGLSFDLAYESLGLGFSLEFLGLGLDP